MGRDRAGLVGGVVAVSQAAVLAVGILLFACIFIFCCGFYIAPEVYQRMRLAGLEHGFRRIQHPPGTVLVERRDDFLPYAANYCAYFVGELRRFDGERQEIIDFYRYQDRDRPFSEDLYIVFVEDEDWGLAKTSISLRREAEPASFWSPIVAPGYLGTSGFLGTSGAPPFSTDMQGDFYVVFLAHRGDFYFDYRCH
ncbi:MAG: hypothetical protein ACK2UA_19360 [Anaerolineae bacterium]|jgi:hypothetical protein